MASQAKTLQRQDSTEQEREEFLGELLRHQHQLRVYIASLSGSRAAVDDILQEVNLTLWRKAESFRSGSSFLAWSSRVAFLKVKEHQKHRRRDQVAFDARLMEEISNRLLERYERSPADERLQHLHDCVRRLPRKQRDLLGRRYADGISLERIAKTMGKSSNALAARLYRVRLALLDCIQRKSAGVQL